MLQFRHPLLISVFVFVLFRRDVIELEETLRLLETTEMTDARQAAAVASGEDEYPESALTELRARHQARATTAIFT